MLFYYSKLIQQLNLSENVTSQIQTMHKSSVFYTGLKTWWQVINISDIFSLRETSIYKHIMRGKSPCSVLIQEWDQRMN